MCSPELLSQIAEVIDSAILISKFGTGGQFDHRIIYSNPAFSKLTGYRAVEVVGRSPDFLCDQRKSGDAMLDFYLRCGQNSGKFKFEIDSFQRQGGDLKLTIDVTPVIDETNNIHYYILMLKPVEAVQETVKPVVAPAARGAVPENLAHYRAQAEAANKDSLFNERYWQSPNNDLTPHSREQFEAPGFGAQGSQPANRAEISTDESIAEYCKTQFLANMSHDLRTPLNAIIGFSEVIKDQLFGPIENPRYVSYAHDIFRSGQALFNTISEIMELSEIRPDQGLTEEERMNICDVIESVLDVLSSKAFEADVRVVKSFNTNDLRFMGDRRKVKQAIAGVVGNIIRHSEKGNKIEISTTLNEKGDLRLSVYTKSLGSMNMASKPSLMGSITRRMENEYPEIALAKRFIEAHDGKFAIFNSAGAGTEIAITLPSARLSIEQEKKTLLKVIS